MWRCQRYNIPVLQITGEYGFCLCLCQRCILEDFRDFAENNWEAKVIKVKRGSKDKRSLNNY